MLKQKTDQRRSISTNIDREILELITGCNDPKRYTLLVVFW
jgi:hypothetical protein